MAKSPKKDIYETKFCLNISLNNKTDTSEKTSVLPDIYTRAETPVERERREKQDKLAKQSIVNL